MLPIPSSRFRFDDPADVDADANDEKTIFKVSLICPKPKRKAKKNKKIRAKYKFRQWAVRSFMNLHFAQVFLTKVSLS